MSVTDSIKKIVAHTGYLASEPMRVRHWAEELAAAEHILERIVEHVRYEIARERKAL